MAVFSVVLFTFFFNVVASFGAYIMPLGQAKAAAKAKARAKGKAKAAGRAKARAKAQAKAKVTIKNQRCLHRRLYP